MDKTTKKQVRSDFKYLRYLMQLADKRMKNSANITDFSESSDIGQLANDMVASATTFKAWVEEQHG